MNTYLFTLTITNSTMIEVEADNYESAFNLAYTEAFETNRVKDLCNPSDVEAQLDLFDEK